MKFPGWLRLSAKCASLNVRARRPLLGEELGDELKSPGDHRRAEVTLTAITSESAQCVCARSFWNIIFPAVGETLLVRLF